MVERGQKIAVVGGGVAGIVAAYLLQRRHEVTLFEQKDYLGGHTHTVEIVTGPDAGLAVDTGFIVLNDATYPLFQRFLADLEVATRPSEMSFGFHCRQTGLLYAGTDLRGLFAQRSNLFRPTFHRFLAEIARFCKEACIDLDQGSAAGMTLGRYLEAGRFSAYMIDNYLVPMAAAIWSTPTAQIADFPAEPFLRFFRNHGLLSLRNRPQWRTVVGGSHAYVKAFLERFRGRVHLNSRVQKIRRAPDRVTVALTDASHSFDQIVVATHADQALRLLENPSPLEERLLSPWTYQKNHAVLHTDASVIPKQKHARAAWNFTREKDHGRERPVFVTYYMNRLQGLTSQRDYCVTLNREGGYRPGTVIAEMAYHHPLYTFESMATQAQLPRLNGERRTRFCGSYFGYGFHEDAVRSGAAVAKDWGDSL